VADLHEQRIAQIVRDFMEAYELAAGIRERLRDGNLQFASVERLVDEPGHSVLHRLKEECHALFRFDDSRSQTELQAEQLFDLAVGALYHEAMKLREGFYLTTSYGPRLEQMMAEGSAKGDLPAAFKRVLEAGRQRMYESDAEVAELFDETRAQLLILLEHGSPSGAVARSLIEHPDRTALVFGEELCESLARVFGSAPAGFDLAFSSLVENGHFKDAAELLEGEGVPETPYRSLGACAYARGMDLYYDGEIDGALEEFGEWADHASRCPEPWLVAAERALGRVSAELPPDDCRADRVRELLAAIRPAD
jgi:hypothetical protein